MEQSPIENSHSDSKKRKLDEQSSVTLFDLPSELLIIILSLLSKEASMNFSLVCKQTREIFERVKFKTIKLNGPNQIFEFIEKSSNQLKGFRVANGDNTISFPIDWSSPASCFLIKKLSLIFHDTIKGKNGNRDILQMRLIVNTVQKLEVLELSIVHDRLLFEPICSAVTGWSTSLKHLFLKANKISPPAFTTILKECCLLEVIHVAGFGAPFQELKADWKESLAFAFISHPKMKLFDLAESFANDQKYYENVPFEDILDVIGTMSTSLKLEMKSIQQIALKRTIVSSKTVIKFLASPASAHLKNFNIYFNCDSLDSSINNEDLVKELLGTRHSGFEEKNGDLNVYLWSSNLLPAFYEIIGSRIGVLQVRMPSVLYHVQTAIEKKHLANLNELRLLGLNTKVLNSDTYRSLCKTVGKVYGSNFLLETPRDK